MHHTSKQQEVEKEHLTKLKTGTLTSLGNQSPNQTMKLSWVQKSRNQSEKKYHVPTRYLRSHPGDITKTTLGCPHTPPLFHLLTSKVPSQLPIPPPPPLLGEFLNTCLSSIKPTLLSCLCLLFQVSTDLVISHIQPFLHWTPTISSSLLTPVVRLPPKLF